MHLLTFLQMLLINIHILDTPIVSFHKYDKILATDLYGDLQWFALAIVNPHTDLPLVFYLVHKNVARVIQ